MWLKSFLRRVQGLWLSEKIHKEIGDELQFHIDMRVEENIRRGMSPDEARRDAERSFGNLTQIKERGYDVRGGRWLETVWQDLRYGVRILLKNPRFALIAVLLLGLCIGANTAIFSLVDPALIKLLPVKDPEQLVVLNNVDQRGREGYFFSYPIFEQLRARTQVFSGVLAAYNGFEEMEMAGAEPGNQTDQARVHLVSGEYFQVLGVNALIGRSLTTTDDQTLGARPVAVLSYRFWQRRFAGDGSVIGKGITLNRQPFTIIGVMPSGFSGEIVSGPDIWVPLMMRPVFDPSPAGLGNAYIAGLWIIARLRSDVSEEQAQASLATILGQIKAEVGHRDPIARGILKIGLSSGRRGFDISRKLSQPLHILTAIGGLALLIACANIANLLLERSTARQKEVAVRLALGAGRFRLIRQFLTESILLAGAGGVLGLLFAWWGNPVPLVMGVDPTTSPIDTTPNARILGFTIVVSLSTALFFGLAPAFIGTRQDVISGLKATPLPRRRLSLSQVFVVAQVALSLILLTLAGVFVQTLRNLHALDLGFDAERIIQASINPESSGYKPDQLPDLTRRLLERLNSAPGIRSASMADFGFFVGSRETCCIAVEGHTYGPNEDRQIPTNGVTPGYFQTMGLPLILGREFTAQEAKSLNVAIINETMARSYFGTSNSLGKRFSWGGPPNIEIIGVAKDAIYGRLRDKARPLIYLPSQSGNVLVARVNGPAAPLLATIRQEIKAVDKNLKIRHIRTVTQEIYFENLFTETMLAKISSIFALLALLLACIGLYGVLSYNVARRAHEIGIRMALGAQGRDVIGLVMREATRMVSIGMIIGLIASLAVTRMVANLLYGLAPNDPLTIARVALLLLTVAALAVYLPSRRAARVDPMVTLRHE